MATQLGFIHTESVSSLVFNSTGALLCSTSLDGGVALWDIAGGKHTGPAATLNAHEDAVNCAAFFADGVRLVTAGEDDAALLWDTRNTAAPAGRLTGVGAGVNRVVLSGDESLVYAAGDDGIVTIHDVATGAAVDRFMVAGAAVNDMTLLKGAFGGACDVLVTGSEDHGLRTWLGGHPDVVKQFREANPRPREEGEEDGAEEAAASDQMPRLLDSVDEMEAAINVVHVVGDRIFAGVANVVFGLSAVLNEGSISRDVAPFRAAQHNDYVRGVATTSAGALFASGDDGMLSQWAFGADAAAASVKAHEKEVMALALAPSEALLATGCEDGTIKLWPAPLA